MMMVQISSAKKEKLSECAEKVLKYAGKLMQCIESLDPEEDADMMDRSRHKLSMPMGRSYEDHDYEEDDYLERGKHSRGSMPHSRYM